MCSRHQWAHAPTEREKGKDAEKEGKNDLNEHQCMYATSAENSTARDRDMGQDEDVETIYFVSLIALSCGYSYWIQNSRHSHLFLGLSDTRKHTHPRHQHMLCLSRSHARTPLEAILFREFFDTLLSFFTALITDSAALKGSGPDWQEGWAVRLVHIGVWRCLYWFFNIQWNE